MKCFLCLDGEDTNEAVVIASIEGGAIGRECKRETIEVLQLRPEVIIGDLCDKLLGLEVKKLNRVSAGRSNPKLDRGEGSSVNRGPSLESVDMLIFINVPNVD